MINSVSQTELTTAATDGILALECIAIVIYLWRLRGEDHWRMGLWSSLFGLTAFASALGAIAHGFEIPDSTRDLLWKPLYLSLGTIVALFVVGAIYDWRGRVWASRLLPWSVAVGIGFFGLTELLGGEFLVFVVYEAVGMLSALVIYGYIAATGKLPGAPMIALAILLSVIAAGLQASDLSARIVFPFDHNGLFHLVQMVSVAGLAYGLSRGVATPRDPGVSIRPLQELSRHPA